MYTEKLSKKIKIFWSKIDQVIPDKDPGMLSDIQRSEEKKFVNPAAEEPVSGIFFASWMNCNFLEKFLWKHYLRARESQSIKSRIYGKLRFIVYMVLKRAKNIAEAYNSLTTEDFIHLGFEHKPSYETIREFLNDRLGNKGLEELFYLIVGEIKRIAESYSIKIGAIIYEDATDVRALKHDPEAKYSGYYNEYGYKTDIIIDADNDMLPLSFTPLEITEDEGKCLIPSLEKMNERDIHPTLMVVDDKYASYRNIAHAGLHNIELNYKIAKGWKYNNKGSEKELKRRYQKYHRKDDFVVNADINYILWFLYKHEDYKYAGAYYRNLAMKEYSDNPEEYTKICNGRSGKMEGFNGILKMETNFDGRLPRRGWDAFVRNAILSIMAFDIAALIRLQHGIADNLTSITYIT